MASDAAGNAASAVVTRSVTVDTVSAVPVISAVATDNIVNATEKAGGVAVSGTAEAGASVVVGWGTASHTATAGTGGAWTTTFVSSEVPADASTTISAVASDAAGNAASAVVTRGVTVDSASPTISGLSPTDGGLSLGLTANLIVTMNEALAKGTGSLTLYKTGDVLVETIAVSSSQVTLSQDGTIVTINPTADLVKGENYYVKAAAGTFTDIAGNAWAGISTATAWNFTGAGATVTIDKVAGDNTVNLLESGTDITVTGTLGAESAVLAAYTKANMTAILRPALGDDMTLTSLDYSPSTGSWSALIPKSSLSGTTDYTLKVSFIGTSGAAKDINGDAVRVVHVDTVVAPPTLGLAVDSGNGNDLLTNNAALKPTGETGSTFQYSADGITGWSATAPTATTGDNTVYARQTDAAGNVSAASTALTFTLDTTAPATPTLALASNSGLTNDSITSAGGVNVTGMEGSGTWEYSLNGGTSWAPGSATSLSLTGDGVKSVTVRQTDLAGNVSGVSSALAFTLDTAAPAVPTLALAINTGLTNDAITSAGGVTVTGLEGSGTWEYSLNGGTSWAPGTTTSVSLSGDGPKSVTVRQTDLAGNLSGASNALAFTLDTTAVAPALALDKDTGISGTDKITSNGKINLTGLESGAAWEYSTNAGTSWTAGSDTSLSLTGDGAKSVTVRQTDVADNRSSASSALAFNLDTGAPSKAVITSMTTLTAATTNRLSGDNTPDITVTAETGAQIVLGQTVNGTATLIDPSWYSAVETATKGTYTVSVTHALADGGYGLGVRDAAGNMNTTVLADGSDLATFAIDTVAPTVTWETAAPQSNGALAVTFKFSEKVYNFDESDISVVNGTKSAFSANADGKTFSALITPSASNTPQAFSFEVAAGAAIDAALNPSAASTKFSASALAGTTGNDVLSVNNDTNWIFLGAGGDDTIKLSSASGSTVAAADRVFGFGAGDKIDVSAILGSASGGSGYTASGLADTGYGFLELKNLVLTKNTASNTTLVEFDISADSASIGGSKISGAVIDLDYQYSLAVDGGVMSPKYTSTKFVWSSIQSNLSPADGGVPNGKIALLADTGSANPIITTANAATGVVLSGELTISGLLSMFQLGFGAKANGGSTEVTTADGKVYGSSTDSGGLLALGVTKTAGATLGVTGALEIVSDTGTLGTVGDNQLHMLTTYDASSGLTRLQVQYDTDSVYGANHTSASSIVAMDFLGDLTSVLTPANLIFIDTEAPSKAVITSMTTLTAATTNRLSGDNTPDITVTAETGAQIVLGQTVNGTATLIDPSWYSAVETATKGTYTVSVTHALADGGYGLGVRDAAGNMNTTVLADGSDLATFAIDTVAPTVTWETAAPQSNGALAVTFKFSEKVYNFDESDISVVNGTKSAFSANADGKTFSALITPSASNTPQAFSFEVAAGAAIDAALNPSAASTKFSASALAGTTGNDVLSVNNDTNWIFLGAGGDDTIKLSSASGSTVAAADRVFGFGAGDKIDVSAILGSASGGSGYTASGLADTGYGFLELKNLVLTKNTASNTTLVEFDISADSASIGGSKISGAVIDLDYQYSLAVDGGVMSPKYTSTKFVWSSIQSNLSPADGGVPNGKIALLADTGSANPIITTANAATGVVLSGELTISGLLSMFQLGFGAKANGGSTEVTTADGKVYGSSTDSGGLLALGVTKTAGATLGVTGALEIVSDTGTLGTVGDNQLHMLTTYDASSGLTRLQVQYDTDSVYGANHTSASSIVAMDFLGDLTSVLTPANLIFI